LLHEARIIFRIAVGMASAFRLIEDATFALVAIVVPIKKGELLLAVCRMVCGIQIDGDTAR
jgi:hypothetical protein